MKNTRDLARILAFILSLMLVLGMIPALATEAEPSSTYDENLLSELIAANSPAELFLRHSSAYCHMDICSGGKLFITNDLYATAESALYFVDDITITCVTPARCIEYIESEGIIEYLEPPEERAADPEYYQTCLYWLQVEEKQHRNAVKDAENALWDFLKHTLVLDLLEGEVFETCEERDGELLITTRMTDADTVRADLESAAAAYGAGLKTDYGDGVEIIFRYRADAADLTAKEFTSTLRLPDGSELPYKHYTFVYDEAMPDPAAPDCALAPAFDETVEQKHITVVFASGTPEEQTCLYTLPADIPIFIQYRWEFVETYEDAACTQPFSGQNGRTEYTLYVKGAAE